MGLKNILITSIAGLALLIECAGQGLNLTAEQTERKKLMEKAGSHIAQNKEVFLKRYDLSINSTNVCAYIIKPDACSLSLFQYRIRTSEKLFDEEDISITIYLNSKVEIECGRQKINELRLCPYALEFGDKVLRAVLSEQEKEQNLAKERYENIKKVFGAKF